MKFLIEVTTALMLSTLMLAVLVGLAGMFFKAWYLVFMLGWNAI